MGKKRDLNDFEREMIVDANRRLENVAWSDESRFLLQHSDDRVKIRHKEHESMDPSRLVSTVRAGGGGVMVWGIFSWYTFLSNNWGLFKHHNLPEYCCWPCPSLYDYSVLFFWCTSSRIMHMSQSSNHLRLVSWTWQWVHFTQMASTVTRSQSIEQLWDVVEREIRIMDIYIYIYIQVYIYIEREREIMGLIPKEHA